MLNRYKCETRDDYENALKEIIQEFALLGLSRSRFFDHAAFYGGTALRIVYDLDRFSEDLDFSLLKPQKKFSLDPHFDAITTELEAVGFKTSVETKKKTAKSAVESAFIKANTKEHLLQIDMPTVLARTIGRDEALKIKLEIDTDPPPQFSTETKYLSLPVAFPLRIFTIENLFAGKSHACLCRSWKSRVKGRDWYDFEWYVARQTPLHLDHLRHRMIQSGHLTATENLTGEDCRSLFKEKISKLDIRQVRADVEKFLRDPRKISGWNSEYFLSLVDRLIFV